MKILMTCLLPVLVAGALCAQQHYDNNWIFSDANGGVIVDFSSGSPEVREAPIAVEFENAGIQISNELGELLCYTNGCDFYNANHELIENGEGLNSGYVYDEFCDLPNRGYPSTIQSTMLLPRPGFPDEYIYLQKALYWHRPALNGDILDNKESVYSYVDMSANNGKGLVTMKNVVFDTTRVEPDMFFNRHENGVDWWLLSPHRYSTRYNVFLIDSSGIHLRDTFSIGILDDRWSHGADQSLFNPAGDQFYRYNSRDGMQIFDFDRETGRLSNFRLVEQEAEDRATDQTISGGIGISPSGQFAYVSTRYKIFQYDLWADDIRASRLLVGLVENYRDLWVGIAPTAINFQLGPDCRLYNFTNTGDEHHVIHRPDERGLACGWEQGWLKLPFPVFRDQMYYPNFRLGPLGKPSSPCAEPLTNTSEPNGNPGFPVRLYPNPVDRVFQIQLPTAPVGMVAEWELFDVSGRTLRREVLRGDQPITVRRAGWPAGTYLWRLTFAGRGIATGRAVLR